MRKIPLVRTFDAIINFSTSFGYFNDRDNFKVLQEVARVLKDRGKFLLEMGNRDAILKGFQPNVGEQIGDIFLLQKNRFDHRTSRIITDWIYFKDDRVIKKTKSELRMYSYHEMDNMLRKAGMRIIKEFGSTKGENFRFDSNRLILVAEKR